MKITYFSNTSTLVEANGKKILTDPWLIGRAYYGSWAPSPPIQVDFSQFNNIDYIHISHIHPDHLHEETLRKLPDVPVLIHNWDSKFVKNNLERWGKRVIELEHGEIFDVGGATITTYAADGCDPAACFNFFGCGKLSHPAKSVGIDTLSVISDGSYRVAQINDCPYALCQSWLDQLLPIDCLLVGYTGASSYPQCWYEDQEVLEEKGEIKRRQNLNMGLNFLKHLKPKLYMPYAGTYDLVGRLSNLNSYRGTLTREEALTHYKTRYHEGRGFLLNPHDTLVLNTQQVINNFRPVVEEGETNYDYDQDPEPTLQDLQDLIQQAYTRYSRMRLELAYVSGVSVYVYLKDGVFAKLPHDGQELSFIDEIHEKDPQFVSYRMDPKLLKRVLMGPKYAHFNNADIGSHIKFERRPDRYDRKLYFLMNFLHV